MPAAIKLTDKDLGWAELQHQVQKLSQGGYYTLVGVQGQEAAANHNAGRRQMTIGDIASIHEFGKGGLPERSFIRAGIDEYREPIQKRATLLGTGVMLQKFTAEQALRLLGEYTVGVLKQRIANGIQPPNAPSTIRRKGSSKPLIDSGQMRNAITYTLERA